MLGKHIAVSTRICAAVDGQGVDEITAQGNSGNIDNAVNEFFTTPDKYENSYQGWNDSVFAADRDGNSGIDQANIPSFNIEGGMDQGIGGGTSGAPTRPPSRRSMYSNRSGQQDGTISNSGQERPQFGPATKDSYDPSQWAMVVSSSTRVYENPEAEERQRDRAGGAPVFFKPLQEQDPLPSLITILGQIPAVRREFLCANLQFEHYGSNMRWWDGENAHAGEANMVDENIHEQDVVEEVQRLMAFMQESDRSYGSVEQLEKLPLLNTATANELDASSSTDYSADIRFLLAWERAAEVCAGPSRRRLFKSAAQEDKYNESDKVIESEITSVSRLELDMYRSEPKQTLYQRIDSMLWDNDRDGTSKDEPCLQEVATVLCMKVKNRHTTQDGSGLGLAVSPVFYADRYLKQNVAATKEMRRRKAALNEEKAELEEQKDKLNRRPHPSQPGKTMDTQDLFERTIKLYKRRAKEDAERKARAKPSSDSDMSMEDEPPERNLETVALQLEKQYQKLKDRLAGKLNCMTGSGTLTK